MTTLQVVNHICDGILLVASGLAIYLTFHAIYFSYRTDRNLKRLRENLNK